MLTPTKIIPETSPEYLASILGRAPIFAEVDADSLRHLACRGVERSLRKRDFAFRQGEAVESFSVVLKGALRAFTQSSCGKEFTLYVLGPGGTMGDGVLFSLSTWHVSAEALVDTLVVSFAARDFSTFAAQNPSVVRKAGETVTSRLLNTAAAVLDVLTERAELRVAKVLLELCTQFGGLVPFSHQQIADMAGTTRQTASKILQDLADQSVTCSLYGSVVILDKDKLRLLYAQH